MKKAPAWLVKPVCSLTHPSHPRNTNLTRMMTIIFAYGGIPLKRRNKQESWC